MAITSVETGCADPEGQFDQFTEDLAKRPPPPTGACGEPLARAVDGTFFAALATELDRAKPVVALATIATDEAGMRIALQPLLVADRESPVGAPIELPATPIDELGQFATEQADVLVPAGANPLLDDDIVMSLIGLAGTACDDVICGDWWGHISEPLALDLHAGPSQFAMIRVEPGEPYPEPPPINCARQLAAPLE